jgi:hypothetical protein
MPAQSSPVQEAIAVLRPWLTRRRALVLAGIVLIVGGLALGWNWLTAMGLAPLILSLAPCLAMCALGLCTMGKGNQASCAKQGTTGDEGANLTKVHAYPSSTVQPLTNRWHEC